MNTFQPSWHTPSPTPAKHSKIAGGLVIAVLNIGLIFSAGTQVANGSTEERDRVRGNPQAPLTLVEYSDFTCGFCEKFFRETWPILFSEYIDTGKVRFVYRDFPRAPNGPSMDTALAARCAGEQGRYWAMHDHLFSSRNKFSLTQLQQQAEKLQIDVPAFTACFEESRYAKDIFADRVEAGKLGFRGTPGFVLYLTNTPQEAVGIPGAFPYAVFKEEIDKLLQMVSSPPISSESL